MKNLPERRSNFLLYSSSDGDIKIDVRLEDETVWLTQKLIAELYQTTPQNITIHLKNIYESGELEEKATCKDFLQVQIEGNRQIKRKQKFYNLDAIISVGYRVNSYQATQFRIWATKTLKEFIIKGFVLNDERLKQGGQVFGKDYFDELLERIREIRASDASIRRSQTSMLYLWIMTKNLRSQKIFLQPFKTNCIGRLQEKLLLKLSILPLMPNKYLWD
jgi:hypothetical protein